MFMSKIKGLLEPGLRMCAKQHNLPFIPFEISEETRNRLKDGGGYADLQKNYLEALSALYGRKDVLIKL